MIAAGIHAPAVCMPLASFGRSGEEWADNMATPYRELAAPARDLAAAAALPPDTYHPRGRWAIVGRQLGWVAGVLAAAELLHLAFGGVLSAFALFGVAYLGLIVQVIRRRRLAFKLIRENDEAVAGLYGSNVDDAARRLDSLAVKARGLGFYHAQVVFNRGVAFIRQGRPEHALALFDAVARSGWFERFRVLGFDVLLASGQSIASAIIDDVPAAEGYLARALSRVSPSVRAKLLMAETLVGLRQGDDRAVAARIEAEWPAAEAVLPVSHLRLLRALQSWAMVRAGADGEAVAKVIERARPSRHGEYDHIAVQWPELKGFLATRVDTME